MNLDLKALLPFLGCIDFSQWLSGYTFEESSKCCLTVIVS